MSRSHISSEFIKELHPTLNYSVDVSMLTASSAKKVWWQCELGHAWETAVANRVAGNNCPYCGNKKLLVGFNDLKTRNPHLAQQWHPTLNENLTPEDVLASHRQKVWWLGKCNHAWKATVTSRHFSSTIGCPYCAGVKVLLGYNDVATTHPHLMSEFDIIKNTVSLKSVSAGSQKKIWWICIKGHSWESEIRSRCSGGGCPYCRGRLISGINDLETKFPKIADEWHPDKNGNLNPRDIKPSDNHSFWWKCKYDHEWWARPQDRTSKKSTSCPFCIGFVSTEENKLAQWLKDEGIQVQQRVKRYTAPYELDIYLPEHQFAIEFNGLYWHSEANGKDKNYHKAKLTKALDAKITLFQVWEDDWKNKPDIIKKMILHRIGKSRESKVYARQTTPIKLTTLQAKEFFDRNHLQGSANGSLYLGLIDAQGTVVAAMTLRIMPGGYAYLERYATSCIVTGGFSKLLKEAIKHLSVTKIITFADRSVSNGDLYIKNGFIKDIELPPDYCYLYRNQRVHKFNFRKKRFEKDPKLMYVKDRTERQLAEMNKLKRIWDSGKTRYVLNVEK